MREIGPARRHPVLLEINTRVYLTELGASLRRPATLDDIPELELDAIRDRGFDWVWFLGIWQTGRAGREISRTTPCLRADYARSLPDFRDEDVVGSPFAVQSYVAHAEYGGDAALGRLRERMHKRGLRLMLDFVVNHVAPDHPWASSHPERFIAGDEDCLRRAPENWGRIATDSGPRILAFGRDPYFPGWADTLQLDYRQRSVREAMAAELERIAQRCDGVRCDMAMLVEPDVFLRTWGESSAPGAAAAAAEPFWPMAIEAVRRRFAEFVFAAEVYWDLEWRLQQRGFDFTYDKRLYDRLTAGVGRAVREHLLAEPDFQARSLRFLENHDEPRAASAFAWPRQRAAAVVAFFVPGMRFFHEGQFDGRTVHVPMHLRRRPAEAANPEVQAFYRAVLSRLKSPLFHEGTFELWPPRAAWEGNPTFDAFVAFSWRSGSGAPTPERVLAVVNYGPTQGQCYVPFPCPMDGTVTLRDLLSTARYERDGKDLCTRGLYLDMPAWGYHLFQVERS